MIRVLQISPFAIPDTPESGGLIRIAETKRAYERAGCEVAVCSIVTKKRDLRNELDLLLPWPDRIWRQHLGKPSNLGPIRQRWATLHSQRLVRQLLGRINRPFDVIHLEHPWAIRLARDLRSHPLFSSALLVYGSHNIEHQLYKSIWEKMQAWNAYAKRLHDQILAAESECAAYADVCWAVSTQDAVALRELHAREVLIAPNGCRTFPPRQSAPGLPAHPYVLFVGGHYQPNIDGFLEWSGPSLSYLPPRSAVIVAGAAGDVLAQMPCYQADLQQGRMINFGKTPQALLDQLILHANAVILPISQGGGTNLKTAEALRSRRPLIATSASMRGFEMWQHDQHTYIASSKEDFHQAIERYLSHPFVTDCDRPALDTLGWEHSLDQAVATTLSHQVDREPHGHRAHSGVSIEN